MSNAIERDRGYALTLACGILSLNKLAEFGGAPVTRHCPQLDRAASEVA